jgi:hypothetical protein
METDQNFAKLLRKASDHRATDEQKRRSLNRLLNYIQRSSRIPRLNSPDYLDALDKTFMWLIRNLDSFEPRPEMSLEESFFRWVNGYLRNRIRDLQSTNKFGTLSLDQVLHEGENQNILLGEKIVNTYPYFPTLDGLDGYIEELKQKKNRGVVLKLEQYVENDPDNQLKKLYPKNKSECNCQILSQQLLFQNPPAKLSQISRDFDVNYQTLKSHWEAKCKPCLQKISLSLGYSPDFEES